LSTIALNRQFFEWREGELSDPDLFRRFGRTHELLTWEAISAQRRVVILAEAGSGKSTEMREQARVRTVAGQFAVYATVEDVGRDNLDSALMPADQAHLRSWRESDENGWFFIDSVDEAKLSGVRLERAIRRLGEGITGAERRAHVILSGRITDWEFRRDLTRLNEGLPVPDDHVLPPPPTADQLLISALRHERRRGGDKETPKKEQALVVLMTTLDPARIRLFAAAKGAPNLDAFLAQIEAANLWPFAGRPLDLGWLVEFWERHGRLGSLEEMLENSLSKRIGERDPDRARGDGLDDTRALHALERIGAALVLERKSTIAIPDSELVITNEERPLDLAQVLPDWSAAERTRLLSRPVFDPATFGRVRLHNDNEAVVRAYLAARWLRRLRQNNLSRGELFERLFATSYRIELIKPSMQETAAWLAIWDEDVGREIARRAPFLLLTAGDPAGLPTIVRETVLTDVIEQIAAGGRRLPVLDHDSVKRFVQADLAQRVRFLWAKHNGHTEAREKLLWLIWLGQLKECADIAEAGLHSIQERRTQIVAGRAIAAGGDVAMKQRYVKYIKARCTALPNGLIVYAIEDLFPKFVSVGDLLEIFQQIDIADSDGGLHIEWQAPGWIQRVKTRAELEQLLRGFLDQLGPEPQDIGHTPDEREETYFSAIAGAAARLLEQCRQDEAPLDAIDAALRLGVAHRYGRHSLRELKDVAAELHRTEARRRLAFWRAAEMRNKHRWLQGQSIEHPIQIELFGYSTRLQIDDVAWLLADAPGRAVESERKLAINTAMRLWRDANEPADVLSKIEQVARADAAMQGAFDLWLNPPPPSPEQIAHDREMSEIREEAEAKHAARDRSWLEFIDRVRRDPNQLRQVRPPNADGVDGRLFHLWQLLSETVDSNSRYAIDSVAPLEPMLGPEVAAALRDGLIQHWRLWTPKLKSARSADERNQINTADCIGVTGISLEARTKPDWAEQLSSAEALIAASYATLEINGFPSWLSQLAVAKPAEVRKVLMEEVGAELADLEAVTRFGVLEDLSRAAKPVVELMATVLFEELERRHDLTPNALAPMLSVIAGGLREHRERFVKCALDRFNNADDMRVGSLHLAAAFNIDSTTATGALMERLDRIDASAQTALVQLILPSIFGTHFRSDDTARPALSFASLQRLVVMAYRIVRIEDDHNRPGGEVYTPDERDHAEQARGAAFNQLVETPGRATFDALLRFAEDPEFPLDKVHLRELARERAAKDSESAPWPPAEVIAFEQTAEAAPRTGKDLQSTALRRLDDMQYDLLHADFAQGSTLKALPDEKAVQNWIADRLRLKQGRAYSVEREPHVVDEKEPDVRLRAKASDASLAVEIKVAESWALAQLEAALTDQLCGRYLRGRDGRHGILLVVHQHARSKGWQDMETGAFLTFSEIVSRLRMLADRIAGADPDAPQAEIATLDVSGCE
jgi:hypothetical protein